MVSQLCKFVAFFKNLPPQIVRKVIITLVLQSPQPTPLFYQFGFAQLLQLLLIDAVLGLCINHALQQIQFLAELGELTLRMHHYLLILELLLSQIAHAFR